MTMKTLQFYITSKVIQPKVGKSGAILNESLNKPSHYILQQSARRDTLGHLKVTPTIYNTHALFFRETFEWCCNKRSVMIINALQMSSTLPDVDNQTIPGVIASDLKEPERRGKANNIFVSIFIRDLLSDRHLISFCYL